MFSNNYIKFKNKLKIKNLLLKNIQRKKILQNLIKI